MSWITAFRGFNHNSHRKGAVCNLLREPETVTEQTQKGLFANLCGTCSGGTVLTPVLPPQKPTWASDPARDIYGRL